MKLALEGRWTPFGQLIALVVGGGLHPDWHCQLARVWLQGRWGSQAWAGWGVKSQERLGGDPLEKDDIIVLGAEGRGEVEVEISVCVGLFRLELGGEG